MKSIIIDDEPLVRHDLREMLSVHRDVEIIGEAETIDTAIELLSRTEPDMVFLDIQLRGGSGFDVVPHVHPSIDIVFFTAHDEYAVRAFEVNALDFLLKPVTADRLAASLVRVRKNRSMTPKPSVFPESPFMADDRIFIKTDEEQRFVSINSIIAVVSGGGNYSTLFLENNDRHLIRRSLKEWEDILPDTTFIRIHRSTIVNLNRIDRLVNEKNGRYSVHMSGSNGSFEVSRREVSKLKRNYSGK